MSYYLRDRNGSKPPIFDGGSLGDETKSTSEHVEEYESGSRFERPNP